MVVQNNLILVAKWSYKHEIAADLKSPQLKCICSNSTVETLEKKWNSSKLILKKPERRRFD